MELLLLATGAPDAVVNPFLLIVFLPEKVEQFDCNSLLITELSWAIFLVELLIADNLSLPITVIFVTFR